MHTFPLSQKTAKPIKHIQATPSFLIGLMDYSRKHVNNEQDVKLLMNKLNIDNASLLADIDIKKVADGKGTKREGPPKQNDNFLESPPLTKVKDESLIIFNTPDQILDYMEYVIADQNINISPHDLIVIIRNLIDSLKDSKISPHHVEQLLSEHSSKENPYTPVLEETKVKGPNETKVMLQREDVPEEQWGRTPEDFIEGLGQDTF